jgi:TRAP-type uncharacterized transport system substrate-binding protein
MSVETIDKIFEKYFEQKRELDNKYDKLDETIKIMSKKMGVVFSSEYVGKNYDKELKTLKDNLWEKMNVHHHNIKLLNEKDAKKERARWESLEVIYGGPLPNDFSSLSLEEAEQKIYEYEQDEQ